ncbi:MAG: two-component regulator propeller domain-containing protein [Mucilaginibacter sp.]
MSISCTQAYAQKYNFTHYDIEDGLIQSQVTMLSQDSAHRLWIGTLGGACRFDGKDYFTISKATGLVNNFVYTVFNDKSGTVWLGTHRGLASFKNNKVYNYAIPPDFRNAWVTQVVQDGHGVIWVVMDRRLFRVNGKKLESVNITGSDESITAINVNSSGTLCAAVFKRGIYALNNTKWVSFLPVTGNYASIQITRILFDRKDKHKAYLLAPRGVFVAKDGLITPFATSKIMDVPGEKPILETVCLSMEQDADNNIWVGTGMGAYYFKNGGYTHFTSKNGFTDNPVTDIYKDADNNLWLASSGSGIFKYEGDAYVTYDATNGLKNSQVVMGIARDKEDNIVLGTEAGLLKNTGNGFIKLSASQDVGRVQNLFTDSKGNLWIGAVGGWKYDGSKITMIPGTERRTVLNFAEDSKGLIWIGTDMGCYYYDDSLHYVEGNNTFTSCLLTIGKDSVLTGLTEGVGLIVNKKYVPGFKLPALANSAIYCIIQSNGLILFGTDDKGVFVWDGKSKILKNYTDKNGLKSNSIYGLTVDDKGIIWVGTGKGVNRMALNRQTMTYTVLQNQYANDLVVESNQNAALYQNNRVFIGTAKGLTVYNTHPAETAEVTPYVMVQQVKLFENGKAKTGVFTGADTGLTLNADQNHLSISFLGVYLKDPQSVSYQYKLTGLEDKFSQPVKTNTVDYPSLPPGKYTFEVRALSPDGKLSANTAKFSFEIVPPFYKTTWFTILAIVLFILLIIALQNLWHRNKKQRELAIETIKREEKIKIRQQTAEDFHDDLGNKLTRITVLSEMLNVKIAKDKPDQQKLVEQIKQNAVSLYNGTKDILWALDPKSDNLYETLKYIEELGIEQFRDMGITFRNEGFSEDFKQIKLTMEYNRNITMIFKELMNNVLKHADAKLVTLKASRPNKAEMVITLSDDGKGFDYGQAAKGHGLKNVKTRAARINGELMVYSIGNGGTNISLQFTINSKIPSA